MTKLNRLIQNALDKALSIKQTPLTIKHTPHVCIKTSALSSRTTKRILATYLKDHSVVSIKTNGWWVCFLFVLDKPLDNISRNLKP